MSHLSGKFFSAIGVLISACVLVLAPVDRAMAFDLNDALDVMGTLSTLAPPADSPDPGPPSTFTLGHSKPVVAKPRVVPIAGLPPRGETRFAKDEVLVETKLGISNADLLSIGTRYRLRLVESQDLTLLPSSVHLYIILDGRTVRAVITALAADRRVRSAQPNYDYQLLQQTADAAQLPQYAIELLHLTDVHQQTTGAAVRVGVLDTGLPLSSGELGSTIVARFDPIGPIDHDDISHGTAIAGIIAARGKLVGVAPGAEIVSARAFTTDTEGTPPASTSYVLLQGLDWLANQQTRIVNMSFAGPKDPLFLRELDKAHDQGIIVIAAAGNDGPKAGPDYPAAEPDTIAVTAIDDREKLFSAANQGTYVAVAAPGVDILVAAPDDSVATMSGTSMAAAHLSGIAALLLQQNPALTVDDFRHLIMTTADDLGPKGVDPQFGAGLANPEEALTQLGAGAAATLTKSPASRP